MVTQPQYDPRYEGYDPEIHGTLSAPSPQRGMAIAVVFAGAVILVALGFVALALL